MPTRFIAWDLRASGKSHFAGVMDNEGAAGGQSPAAGAAAGRYRAPEIIA